MWGRSERRDPDPTEEGDAFRTGRYADYLVSRRQLVPPWAWVNALAHGSEVLVASLALAEPGPRDAAVELRSWYAARKALAEEVVSTLGVQGCSLDELQQGVLVGLELELAALNTWASPDPEELTCLVLDALHAYRDRSRH